MVIKRPTVTALVFCLAGAFGLLSGATTTASKQSAAKSKTATKSSASKTSTAKTSTAKSTSKKKYTKTAHAPYRKPAPRQSFAPVSPASNRIREVQQALVERGYLQSEANGTWNAASIEALKRFESDQKVRVDGKIDSKTLIALGLGPKYDNNLNLPVPGASGNVVAADQSTNNDAPRN